MLKDRQTNRRSAAARTKSEVAAEIRKQIVAGKLKPGQKFPSRPALRDRLGSTFATIQRAFDELREQRFVETKTNLGTYVSSSPPHLCQYALIVDDPSVRASPKKKPRYWMAMEEQMRQLQAQEPDRRRFDVFHLNGGIDVSRRLARLNEMIKTDQFAGLIFAALPQGLEGSPLLDWPGVPRAIISRQPYSDRCAHIVLEGFLPRSLDHLRRRGRKRIAFLMPPSLAELDDVNQLLDQRGQTSRPIWQQAIYYSEDDVWVHNLASLLLAVPPADRPDGLVIADDNVVEAATQGIRSSGVRVPDDLEVVAHANFPSPTRAHVAATRVGYDVREILRRSIDWIDARRAGKPTESRILINAVTEPLTT